jgi:hypothetical protein
MLSCVCAGACYATGVESRAAGPTSYEGAAQIMVLECSQPTNTPLSVKVLRAAAFGLGVLILRICLNVLRYIGWCGIYVEDRIN